MDEEIKADKEVVTPAVTDQEDPLKTEFEKTLGAKRTKEEKLLYTKKRIEEQLEELGIEPEEEDEDSKPLTLGMLKRINQETVVKTALDLTDDIPNEMERQLVRYHLENTIKSSGNPKKDLELAQGLVNSVKNQQILEETLRKPNAATHTSGGGAPAKKTQAVEFTEQEQLFMRPPFNLTKEQVIASRPK